MWLATAYAAAERHRTGNAIRFIRDDFQLH